MSKACEFGRVPVGRTFIVDGEVWRKETNLTARNRWRGTERFSPYDTVRLLRPNVR